jgi:drug/metabolite transporter (DMT)-like permease
MSSVSRARLQLIGAALLFSTGGAAIKAAEFTSWQIASFRSGFAALALLLIVAASRRDFPRTSPQFGKLLLVGCAYAACLTLFVLANRLTTAANTIFLQSTPRCTCSSWRRGCSRSEFAGRMSGSCWCLL